MNWRIVCVFLILPLAPAVCFAWGTEGHQIVGEIATGYLTEHSKQEIAALLEDDLDAHAQPSGRKTLAEVSTWADEIRATATGRRTAPWHYENVPVCGQPHDICPDGNCASVQLERHLKVLADRNQSIRIRNEALKWIVHLVGDIHQPLHASDNADRGGNSVLVRGGNLHALWDVTVVRLAISKKLFDQPPEMGWQTGSVASWMQESHALAETVVYGKLPSWACNAIPEGRIDYGEGYLEAAALVAADQIKKAGVRLAQLLNEALR